MDTLALLDRLSAGPRIARAVSQGQAQAQPQQSQQPQSQQRESSLTNPRPRIRRTPANAPASPVQALEDPQEDEQSLTDQAVDAAWGATKAVGGAALSGLSMIGNLLDLPGSMIRDVLVFDNPFDQILDPLSHSATGRSASGRDVLARNILTSPIFTENKETGMSGWLSDPLEGVQDILGFGAELALGGLTRTPGALIKGRAASASAAPLAKAAGAVDSVVDDAADLAGAAKSGLASVADDLAESAKASDEAADAASAAAEVVKNQVDDSILQMGSPAAPLAEGTPGMLDRIGATITKYDPGTYVGKFVDKHIGELSSKLGLPEFIDSQVTQKIIDSRFGRAYKSWQEKRAARTAVPDGKAPSETGEAHGSYTSAAGPSAEIGQDLQTLIASGSAARGSRLLTPSELNEAQDLATRMGDAFGTQVLFWGGGKGRNKAAAVRIQTAGNRVWVNSDQPFIEYYSSVGHEMLHLLRDVDNDAFNQVLDIIHHHAPPEMLPKNAETYRAAYEKIFNRKLAPNVAIEEGAATTVEHAFGRVEFWEELIQTPSLATKVQDTFSQVLGKLKESGKVTDQELRVLDRELSTFFFGNAEKLAAGATEESIALAQAARYSKKPGKLVSSVDPMGDLLATPGSAPARIINSAEDLISRINAGIKAAMYYKVNGHKYPVVQHFAEAKTNKFEAMISGVSLPAMAASETISKLADDLNLDDMGRLTAMSDMENSLAKAIERGDYKDLHASLHPIAKQLQLSMSALHERSVRSGLQLESLWDDYVQYFPHTLHSEVLKKLQALNEASSTGLPVSDLSAAHHATQAGRNDLFRNAYYGRETWNAATSDPAVLDVLDDFKGMPGTAQRIDAAAQKLRELYMDTIDPRIPVTRGNDYVLLQKLPDGGFSATTVSPRQLAGFERVPSPHDLTTAAGRLAEHTEEPIRYLHRAKDDAGREIITEFEMLTGRPPGDHRYGNPFAKLPDGSPDLSQFGHYASAEEALDRHAHLADWMGEKIGTDVLRRTDGAFSGSAMASYERVMQARVNSLAAAEALPEFLRAGLQQGVIRQATEDSLKTGRNLTLKSIFGTSYWGIVDRKAAYRRLVAIDKELAAATKDLKAKELIEYFDNLLIDEDVFKDLKTAGSFMPKSPALEGTSKVFGSLSSLWKSGVLTHPGRYVRDLMSGAAQLAYGGLFSNTAAELANAALFNRPSPALLHYGAVKNYLDRFGLEHTPENATRAVRVMFGNFMRGSGNIYQDYNDVLDPARDAARGMEGILDSLPGDGRTGWLDTIKGVGKTAIRKEGAETTSWNPFDVAGVMHAFDKVDDAGRTIAKRGDIRTESAFAPVAAGNIAGKHTNDFNRLVGFIEGLRRGDAPIDAWKNVDWNQINYNPKTFAPGEKILKKIFPFYSFMSRETAWVAHELLTNPNGRLGKIIRAVRLSQPDNEFLPQHLTESPALPLGGEDSTGTQNYLTGFGLMFEDPLRMAGNLLSGQSQDFARDLLSDSNPLIKGVAEWGLGRSSFQGGPLGGRDLADMDPVLGRIFTQVGLQKERPGGQAAPAFGSRGLEFMLANSPISRILSSVKTSMDERKNILERSLNILSGLRISSVSPEQRQRGVRELTNALAKDIGARPFTTWHISDELLADAKESNPEQYQALLRIKEMRKQMDRQQRIKRKEQAASQVTPEAAAEKVKLARIKKEQSSLLRHSKIQMPKEEREQRIKRAMSESEGSDMYYAILTGRDMFE